MVGEEEAADEAYEDPPDWFLVGAGEAFEGGVGKIVARAEDIVSEGTESVGCDSGGGGHGG